MPTLNQQIMQQASGPAAAEAQQASQATPATQTDPEVEMSLEQVGDSIKQTVMGVWSDFVDHIPFLISGVVVILITWLVAYLVRRLGNRLFGRSHMRDSLKDLIIRLLVIAVWTFGLLLAAMVVFPGVTPAKALGALGLVSIAVGFAFKDIFENFFAGILLLWRFPFEKGDFIECEDIVGSVESIEIRMTQIRQTDGQLVVLPNSFLFKNPVNVLTDRDRRRVTIIAGVAYGEDASQAIDVIEKAVSACKSVDTNMPVQVFAKEFGASSVDIEVAWWTEPRPVDIRRSRSEVVLAIKRALDEAGIEIPFPYRTLTFKEPLTVQQRPGE